MQNLQIDQISKLLNIAFGKVSGNYRKFFYDDKVVEQWEDEHIEQSIEGRFVIFDDADKNTHIQFDGIDKVFNYGGVNNLLNR